ncbi:hypothetical protein [secondary endosymbiont of Ctenarytaina eucalypti]|uniref:hypothetical protein n=1 Tax=secondary endosymbiont of Ctenarytaina eucalypti TaxID=1199245 RepID=UPI00135C00B3|nr:hypothetical protein [secondary endosymbiont of Ctenarytaina eucalypti]
MEQIFSEPFIANPLLLSDAHRMLIITGFDVGAKSTYNVPNHPHCASVVYRQFFTG